MIDRSVLVRRAEEYARRVDAELGPELGYGVHGIVLTLESGSRTRRPAIKVFERERFYRRERDVYFRLAEEEVASLRGCTVPEMLRYDDELCVIEMTVVTPPYVLDFAGAYLDEEPGYSPEILRDWESQKEEQFDTDWPHVRGILRDLEKHGVYLMDVSPSNVRTRA